MVLDREKRGGQEQDEQEQEQRQGGELFVYWVPAEADTKRGNTRERLHGVLSVRTTGAERGLLLVRTVEGVASFDRQHIRGWRTVGDVEVPDALQEAASDGGE